MLVRLGAMFCEFAHVVRINIKLNRDTYEMNAFNRDRSLGLAWGLNHWEAGRKCCGARSGELVGVLPALEVHHAHRGREGGSQWPQVVASGPMYSRRRAARGGRLRSGHLPQPAQSFVRNFHNFISRNLGPL